MLITILAILFLCVLWFWTYYRLFLPFFTKFKQYKLIKFLFISLYCLIVFNFFLSLYLIKKNFFVNYEYLIQNNNYLNSNQINILISYLKEFGGYLLGWSVTIFSLITWEYVIKKSFLIFTLIFKKQKKYIDLILKQKITMFFSGNTIKNSFAILLFATILTLIGAYQARHPEIKYTNMPIKNLPDVFQNYKIVFISDLHVSYIIDKKFVAKIVNIINGLNPDTFIIGGDIADLTVDIAIKHVEDLQKIHVNDYKIYILGNHEEYWGKNNWLNIMKKFNYVTLVNDNLIIQRNNEKIMIVGAEDITHIRTNLYSSLIDKSLFSYHGDFNIPKILICHNPKIAYYAKNKGLNALISGHTHAGQFFPINIFVYLFHQFVSGLYLLDDFSIYISKGVGYWGIPLRTFVPSEISVLNLVKLAEDHK